MHLGYDATLPPPFVPQLIMFAAMGGLGAALANRGTSVFHDGLRPVIPSLLSGEISRKEVSRTSWTLAWGFVWAFGLPYSLGFTIPLIYLVLIMTDWIGVSMPADYDGPWYRSRTSRRGLAQAVLAGGVYGAGVAALLRGAAELMDRAPVPMADPVRLITVPALGAFFLFTVLTAAYHFGIKRCLPTLLAAAVAWFAADGFDWGEPAAWAFGASFVVLVVELVREARTREQRESTSTIAAWAIEDDDEDDVDAADFFADRVKRIKRAIVPLVVLAAISGAAYNWGLISKDPISAHLYPLGLVAGAFCVMVAWAFMYIPMKLNTAVMTGCMATGTFLDAGIALLMPNPWVAAVAVGALKVGEIYALLPIFRLVQRVPTIRQVADVMRTSVFHVMEIAFLIGGALAAQHFAGQFGLAVVIGAWFINQRAGGPIMPMSLGAFAALAVGVLANLLHVIGVSLT